MASFKIGRLSEDIKRELSLASSAARFPAIYPTAR